MTSMLGWGQPAGEFWQVVSPRVTTSGADPSPQSTVKDRSHPSGSLAMPATESHVGSLSCPAGGTL
jgi:hypothetical protein